MRVMDNAVTECSNESSRHEEDWNKPMYRVNIRTPDIEFDNNDDAHDQAAMLEKKGSKNVRKIGSQEKMTGVKNAQAEMLLRRLCDHYKHEAEYLVTCSQTESFTLKHQYKLLNLDKKTNEIVMKKRRNPFADYSYDETVVNNLKKYLNRNAAPSCWLQKKNDHKIRSRSLPNVTTPLVAQARNSLRQQAMAKKFQAEKANMYTFITQEPKEPARVKPVSAPQPKQEEELKPLTPQEEKVFKLAIKKPKSRVQVDDQKLPEVERTDCNSAALRAVCAENDVDKKLPQMVKIRPSSEAKPAQDVVMVDERRAQSLLPGLEKRLCAHRLTDDQEQNSEINHVESDEKMKKLMNRNGIKPKRNPNAKSPTVREKMLSSSMLVETMHQQRQTRARPKTQKSPRTEVHPALRPEKKPLTNELLKKEFANIQQRVSGFCEKMHTEIELDKQEEQYYKLRFVNLQKQALRRMKEGYESSDDDDDDDLDHDVAVPDIFIIRKRRKELRNPTRPRGYYKAKFISAVNKVIARQRQLRPKGKLPKQPEFMKRLLAGIADPLMETALRQPKEEKIIRGVPRHAKDRSKRHTATYQLQQMVKKMMSSANKFQQQELDKARGDGGD